MRKDVPVDKNSSAAMQDARAPLRLLEVVTRLDIGGVPTHLILLVEGLRARGYHITVACGECTAEHEARLKDLGVALVHAELRRLLSPVADVRGLLQLYGLIRKGGFDIVHSHMSKGALLGGLAGWLARAPVKVNSAHNLGFIAMPKAWIRALFWLYDKVLLSVTMDAVITESNRMRRAVVDAGMLARDKVVSIPNGIGPATPTDVAAAREALLAEIGGGRWIVGTVARLVWFKGLHVLVAAAAQVARSCPGCKFVVIGDGPLRGTLEHQVHDLGLAETFVFLGPRPDVLQLHHVFDLFALPSMSEGMPITLLEAMAAAKAVVATQVGAIPELVADGETGLLVPPNDAQALAGALVRLLQDSALRTSMGEKGRDRVARHFSTEQMVASTDDLFRRLRAAKRGKRRAPGPRG